MERFFLYDDIEQSRIRFVSFVGTNERFDLAIIHTDRFYGKALVLDMQSHRYAIVGHDDLAEEGYIEDQFQLSEVDANELRSFLEEVVQ